MALSLGIQLIIAFRSACRSFRGMRISTTPQGEDMNGNSLKYGKDIF